MKAFLVLSEMSNSCLDCRFSEQNGCTETRKFMREASTVYLRGFLDRIFPKINNMLKMYDE